MMWNIIFLLLFPVEYHISPSVPSGISYFSTLQFSFCSQWNIIFLLLFPVEYHISPSVPSIYSTGNRRRIEEWRNMIFYWEQKEKYDILLGTEGEI
jgi:hypothetical protein